MRAYKEQCQILLDLLAKNSGKIPADVYDRLHTFLMACKPRLPTLEAIQRDSARKAERPSK